MIVSMLTHTILNKSICPLQRMNGNPAKQNEDSAKIEGASERKGYFWERKGVFLEQLFSGRNRTVITKDFKKPAFSGRR